jgi:hypothetical protein
MAASSNDSFGLKIATAFSIALTVILLVSVYFLNSSYNQEFEKRAAAEKKASEANQTVNRLTQEASDYRTAIGYGAIEEAEAVKAAMKKDLDQIKTDLQAIDTETTSLITDFQKKAEAKNVDPAQIEALKQRNREVIQSFLNNPNPSYISSLGRLKDLMINQAKLTTSIATGYIDLRRDLEMANQLNKEATDVVRKGLADAKTELEDAIKKGEEARQEVVADRQKKADDLASLETKLQNLNNKYETDTAKLGTTIRDLNTVLKDKTDVLNQKEDVMTKPGGRVTYVDYGSGTVRVSVNRSQGVRPLMRFTVFDKTAAGITSDKPKASLELVRVGDPQRGENDSLARIIKTFNTEDPIRYNDYIFSVGWSYDHPQRFDLIGKLDINRDGKDDRADLIRMIEAAGGVVEFDLPPPNVDRTPGQAAVARAYARFGQPVPPSIGRATGKITGLSYAYVTDRRSSLILFAKKEQEPTKEETAYIQEESAATKEARDTGVRPMPLEKLLNYLGYDYQEPIEGRREAYDRYGVQQLLKKKAVPATPPAPAAGTTKSDMPADAPK